MRAKREVFGVGGKKRKVREFRDKLMYQLADIQRCFTFSLSSCSFRAFFWKECSELEDLGLEIVKLTNTDDERKAQCHEVAHKLSP